MCLVSILYCHKNRFPKGYWCTSFFNLAGHFVQWTDNFLPEICQTPAIKIRHEIPHIKFKANSRTFQGLFNGFQGCCNLAKCVFNYRVAAPIWDIGMRRIAKNGEFKDFNDHYQNLTTFQGSSKIFTENQGLFKDWHEIQGLQVQGCEASAKLFNIKWSLTSTSVLSLLSLSLDVFVFTMSLK